MSLVTTNPFLMASAVAFILLGFIIFNSHNISLSLFSLTLNPEADSFFSSFSKSWSMIFIYKFILI